jgi:hypothetical protein
MPEMPVKLARRRRAGLAIFFLFILVGIGTKLVHNYMSSSMGAPGFAFPSRDFICIGGKRSEEREEEER